MRQALWDAQVPQPCWGERGGAEAVRLLKVCHGALLRAGLSEHGLESAPISVQAAAGSHGVGECPHAFCAMSLKGMLALLRMPWSCFPL